MQLTHAQINRLFASGDNNPRRMPALFEDFKKRPALNAVIATDENSNAAAHLARNLANRDFEVLGTNATTALVTFGNDGGLTLTTAGASADQIIIAPHLDTNQTKWTATQWSTDKEIAWRSQIATGASIADVTIWAGHKLTNTSVTATDNDQIFFRYNASVNEGRLQFVYSASGTDYALDTGIEVEASMRYTLGYWIDANRIPFAFVGVGNEMPRIVQQGTVAMTAAITALIPYVGIQAGAAAAKAMQLYTEEASRAW